MGNRLSMSPGARGIAKRREMREKWSQNDDMPKLPYALHLGKLVFFVELWQEKEAVAVKLRELVAIERPGRGEVGGVGVPRGRRDAVV